MKILMVNKFFYIKGGSETYYFSLKRLLESKGHKVIDFSMKDDKNFESSYSDYFVENIDFNYCSSISDKIKSAGKIIYSKEAKNKFEDLVKKTNPDLVHLHIFQHQLSPSILDVIKKYNIPTVYTAHDLKMLCLNYKMMTHGKVCEKCINGHFFQCAKNRCVKDSFIKSCINVFEGYLHKYRKSYEAISTIITPSLFYKRKFEEFGIEKEKVIHIPNFIERKSPFVANSLESKKYYLYFGRLSEEKGIKTLIHAVKNMRIKLYVVGTGPIQQDLESLIKDNHLDNIKLLGFKSGQELINIVGNAKAVILPSEWYENGPYSAIEALQMGRPIIGANIGGIPELVHNNGYLFESGNIGSLKSTLIKFESISESDYEKMENESKNLFFNYYTAQIHYQAIKKVYEKNGVLI